MGSQTMQRSLMFLPVFTSYTLLYMERFAQTPLGPDFDCDSAISAAFETTQLLLDMRDIHALLSTDVSALHEGTCGDTREQPESMQAPCATTMVAEAMQHPETWRVLQSCGRTTSDGPLRPVPRKERALCVHSN